MGDEHVGADDAVPSDHRAAAQDGRDSVIGSNVFITHSIPACTTVSVKSQELQFKPRNCEGNCSTCSKPEPFWENQTRE